MSFGTWFSRDVIGDLCVDDSGMLHRFLFDFSLGVIAAIAINAGACRYMERSIISTSCWSVNLSGLQSK